MMELWETGYSVVITAAKEEGEGCKEFGFLDAKFLE